jgi:4-amino-4-deoxy-L-arabinose transferase-like glycosyltransferase
MHDTPENRPSLSLILPAWNEAAVIATAIAEADEALALVADDYEIIVVDDGSTDNTAAIVRESSIANRHVRLVQHSPNQGYGAAIRSGFAAAEKSMVVFTDADCQFDLTELDRFVLLSSRYDIVCGYRIDRKDTPLRCLYSNVYNLIVRFLLGTGVRDVDCALKMFHRDVAKKLQIRGNGFLVNSEMLVQARQSGYRVCEVGVSHRPRTMGESTVSVSHIPKVLVSLARYWWNHVQFPPVVRPVMDQVVRPVVRAAKNFDENPHDALSLRSWSVPLLQIGLLLIAALFMLTNLDYPLIDRDETRYAEIAREMLATGDWVVPKLNFQTYYDKPPLVYWLCATSFKLFGVSETSARFVPALASLATLVSTMYFGSRIFNRRVGLLAGVVLLVSVGFAFTSRYLLLDSVLSLLVSLSLFTAYEAIGKPRLKLGWWMASSVCVGLAVLTKGPIAIVLWLPPVFAFAWLSQTAANIRRWHCAVFGLLAATIAAPWFIGVHLQDPKFLLELLYKHNVSRFFGDFHSRPFWFFVPVLLVAGHPWSFLTLPYARFLLGRDESSRNKRVPAVGYLLLWSVWCLVFFSLSACKLPTYLLPAAPALALMLGHYLSEVLYNPTNPSDVFVRFWSARTATATTCFAGFSIVLFVIVWTDTISVSLFGWTVLWLMLLMVSLFVITDRRQMKIVWPSALAIAFVFVAMAMHQMVPTYSRSQSLLDNALLLAGKLDLSKQPPIATIGHEFAEVPFYLDRSDIVHFENVDENGIDDFVSNSEKVILIVSDRITPSELANRLPKTASLDKVGHRGSATIFQATHSKIPGRIHGRIPGRIAEVTGNTIDGTQR